MAKADVVALQRFVADTCSTSEWKMLIECLPHAVENIPDERHKYQTELLDLMAQALHDSWTQAKTDGNGATEGLEAAKGELETRKRKAEDANAAKESAALVLLTANQRLAEARAAVVDAEKCHKPADKEKTNAMARKGAAQEQRDQAKAVSEGPLTMLRSGGWGEADVYEDAAHLVTQLLKTIRAEETLISASAGAFREKPEKRRRFDTIVENGVVEVIDKYISQLDSALKESTAHAEDVEAEALGLWAISDCARDKLGEVHKHAEEAKAAQLEASTYCVNVDAEVKEHQKLVEDAASNLNRQSDKIQEHEDVIQALDRLRRYEYATSKAEPPTQDVEKISDIIVDKSSATDTPLDAAQLSKAGC